MCTVQIASKPDRKIKMIASNFRCVFFTRHDDCGGILESGDYSEQVQPLSDPIKVLKAKKPWP